MFLDQNPEFLWNFFEASSLHLLCDICVGLAILGATFRVANQGPLDALSDVCRENPLSSVVTIRGR